MKISILFNTCFKESSIHGFPYIVRKSLQIIERIFWLLVVLCATYISISICWDQWQRFKNNPIVYSVEKNKPQSQFPFVGVTLCSNYSNDDFNAKIVKKMWDIDSSNEEKFDYYMKFLQLLSTVTYENMKLLEPYTKDSVLNTAPLLNLSLEMRMPLPYTTKSMHLIEGDMEAARESINRNESISLTISDLTYATAVTEVGICVTTSTLNEYQNPYGGKSVGVSDISYCTPVNLCNFKVTPFPADGSHVRTYLHNVNEILDPGDRGTIIKHVLGKTTLDVIVDMGLTTAEREVRNLPITYRKCRYPNENNLHYFKKYYSPSLCRIECRIRTALELCQCKPFFYVVGNHKTCDISGMMCLVNKQWPTSSKCDCFPLCEEYKYTELSKSSAGYENDEFERVVLVTMNLPTMTVKRRVVFSTDQLVVSLGGAASFFLGCNFLSFVEFFYFFVEYLSDTIINLFKRPQ